MPSRPEADLSPGRLLDGLTPAQREAVTSEAFPLVVLAGAGSGKTRVLTRRVAYRVATGSAQPSHVLALTFTRKAAGELSSRLLALGLREKVTAGTFHSVALAQLRGWWADQGRRPPALLDRKSRILGPLLESRAAFRGVPLAEVASVLEWSTARLAVGAERLEADRLEVEAIAAGRPLPVPAEDLVALFERYRHEKTRRGLIDFDDLISGATAAMEANPAFAAAQQWRWRHVFVDEAQDLNPLQNRLLMAWLGTSADLCLVGDPNQAVYGWNGADPRFVESVPLRWPDAGVVRLDVNHRCAAAVVAAGSAVLGGRAERIRSGRDEEGEVTVRSWESSDAEALGVAAHLRSTQRHGVAWSQMAVLARTNAQAAELAAAARSAGVPVRAAGLLLEHPAVLQALDALAQSASSLVGTAAGDLDEWARSGVVPASATGRHEESSARAGSTEETRTAEQTRTAEALRELADLARSAASDDPTMRVREWLAWLPAQAGRDPGRTGPGDAVTICSFHRAKGLEWDSVWVCGLESGLVPIGRAATADAVEEERRLLYVALTRAGRSLYCSWAAQRRFSSSPALVRRQPSPWLQAIEATTAAGGRAGERPDRQRWRLLIDERRDHLRSSRRAPLAPVGWEEPDQATLEALRAWRAGVARASAVPAHVVLHDSALVAVASLRPGDREALVTVPGVGAVKANRFGDAILDVLARADVPA